MTLRLSHPSRLWALEAHPLMFVFRSHGVPQALTRAMTQSPLKGPEAALTE